jgi:hypothetical protein
LAISGSKIVVVYDKSDPDPTDALHGVGRAPAALRRIAQFALDVIRRSALAELMAEDGAYRGAVRPLTGPTPTLSAPRVAVPPGGGTVMLRGAHLAGVDAVHLGGVAVRRFVQHSDSTIVFRAPAHDAGTIAVTVSTSWQAQSRSVTLTYAQPRPSSTLASPTAPAPPTPSSTLSISVTGSMQPSTASSAPAG